MFLNAIITYYCSQLTALVAATMVEYALTPKCVSAPATGKERVALLVSLVHMKVKVCIICVWPMSQYTGNALISLSSLQSKQRCIAAWLSVRVM